ncbi:MAG: copper chaperone PCu(A)C [Pseudomonadota bacterium]
MKFLHSHTAPLIAALLVMIGSVLVLSKAAHHAQDHMQIVGDGIVISEAYMRANTPTAPAAAAYMVIKSGTRDRLIAATTEIARRVELHTHMIDSDGIVRMEKVEAGFDIPAGGAAHLDRGGDHVMLMGLSQALNQGDVIPMTLLFEKAGEVTIDVVVDHDRKPDADHSNHNH